MFGRVRETLGAEVGLVGGSKSRSVKVCTRPTFREGQAPIGVMVRSIGSVAANQCNRAVIQSVNGPRKSS